LLHVSNTYKLYKIDLDDSNISELDDEAYGKKQKMFQIYLLLEYKDSKVN